MARRSARNNALRSVVAQEAARIMADEGVRDYLAAKRKAAGRVGIDPAGQGIPTNLEIEDALHAHQRLFGGERHAAALMSLRAAAREAMSLFGDFDARLTGPVLRGTAGPGSPVDLHLFADASEEVALFLMQRGIPFENSERRLKHGDGRVRDYPVFRFVAGDVRIEATVFTTVELRQSPLGPVDGKPMQRANLREVDGLINGDRYTRG